jgi:1-acyl-sn-glycerol-3-phosphate acyltransferase
VSKRGRHDKKRKRDERAQTPGEGPGERLRAPTAASGRPSFFFSGLFSRAPAPTLREPPTAAQVVAPGRVEAEALSGEGAALDEGDELEPSPISESFRDVEATRLVASPGERASLAELPLGDSIPEALGRAPRAAERAPRPAEPASEHDDDVDLAPIGPTEPPRDEPAPEPARAHASPRPRVEVESEIALLEARLDALLAERDGRPAAASAPRSSATARDVDAALYEAQRKRIEDDTRAFEIDELGLDPAYEQRLMPLLDFLYERWFRVEISGLENVPTSGPVVLVANHAGGTIPLDGLVLRAALRRAEPRRELRFLTEDAVYHLPFAGAALTRLGAVRACPENAERLLARGEAIAVFPEGEKGLGKPASLRYRLQRFGRGGFVRLCLRARAPLVPCAIVGSEETSPTLGRLERLPRLLGLPSLPISALGALPAPAKWRVQLGPLRRFSEPAESADDEDLVARLADETRRSLAAMLEGMLRRRRSVLRG